MTTQAHEKLLSVKEIAAAYGCSVTTIWRRVSDGTLPKPIKIGGMSRWKSSEIEEVVDRAVQAREAA